MDIFTRLEEIIALQDRSKSSTADVLQKLGCPSVSIAILENGSISARMYSTIRHDEETVFQACSISKPIGQMATMRLIQAGKLRLDAPITEYLSDDLIQQIVSPSTHELVRTITIKQLLSHTSGLSQHGFPGYRDNPANIRQILSGVPPSNTPQVHLLAMPGQRFAYSGGGMTVLQLIVEEITGKPFAEVVQELVFDPLEMKRSFYRNPTKSDNYADVYWTGVTKADCEYNILPEQAAAGVWTTPSDMLKVIRGVQRSLKDGQFLSKDLAREMLTEVDLYGLAWAAPKNPGNTFCHGGSNNPGYRCILLGFADLGGKHSPDREECGMAIMTNSVPGDDLYQKLVLAIAYLKKWPLPLQDYVLSTVIIPFPIDVSVDTHWKDWEGTWGDWKVYESNGGPVVKFQELPPVRLLSTAFWQHDGAINLVLNELELMFRLIKKNESNTIELWDGILRKRSMLSRVER